jgi:hypothetical protein
LICAQEYPQRDVIRACAERGEHMLCNRVDLEYMKKSNEDFEKWLLKQGYKQHVSLYRYVHKLVYDSKEMGIEFELLIVSGVLFN